MSICTLKHKESKKNALNNLQERGITDSIRELLDEEAFEKLHTELIGSVNRAYNLNVSALFTLDTQSIPTGGKNLYNRERPTRMVTRVVPIESVFEQIDEVRKKLDIYDTKESIGSYRQRNNLVNKDQSLEMSNQKISETTFDNSEDSVTFTTEDSPLDWEHDESNDTNKRIDDVTLNQILKNKKC